MKMLTVVFSGSGPHGSLAGWEADAPADGLADELAAGDDESDLPLFEQAASRSIVADRTAMEDILHVDLRMCATTPSLMFDDETPYNLNCIGRLREVDRHGCARFGRIL